MRVCVYKFTIYDFITASQGLYRLENLQNVTGPNRVYGKVKYAIKDDDFGDDDLGLLIYVDNMYPPIGFKVRVLCIVAVLLLRVCLCLSVHACVCMCVYLYNLRTFISFRSP